MKAIRCIFAAACMAAATAAADPWDLASEAYVGHAVADALAGAMNEMLPASYTNETSVALGNGAKAAGDSSAALGRGATATGYASAALGQGARATHKNSVVISTGTAEYSSRGDGTVTLGVENGLADVYVGTTRMDAAIESSVRAAAYAVADYIFDAETSVCYRRMMRGGYLDYVAVTNIDVRLPENYAALVALEESR